jgi:hypothetical protein
MAHSSIFSMSWGGGGEGQIYGFLDQWFFEYYFHTMGIEKKEIIRLFLVKSTKTMKKNWEKIPCGLCLGLT